MPIKGDSISDPELYRKLREPFESIDEYKEACEKFFNGWRELREACGIPDVLMIISSSVLCEGLATEMMSMQTSGDVLKEEAMAAYAFGRAQEQREMMIGRLLGKSPDKRKRDKGLFD
jgi:hypothetical protein